MLETILSLAFFAYALYGLVFCGARLYQRAGRSGWWIIVPIGGPYVFLRIAGLSKRLASGLIASVVLLAFVVAQGVDAQGMPLPKAEVPMFLFEWWMTSIFAYATMRIARAFSCSWKWGLATIVPLVAPFAIIMISRSKHDYVDPSIDEAMAATEIPDRSRAFLVGLMFMLLSVAMEKALPEEILQPEEALPSAPSEVVLERCGASINNSTQLG